MQKYSNFTNISENILNIKRTKCFHFYPEFFSFLTSVSLFKKKERLIVLLKEIVCFLSEEQPFKGSVREK